MNVRRRSYGTSWTASKKVALGLALSHREMSIGGTVLLKTDAPAEAIIARVPKEADQYGEHEYWVDRRQLRKVKVVKRFLPADPPPTE
jgi:hypothetical protein